MEFVNKELIRHITLISSESCNLNCSYCEIAKSASIYHNKEQAKKVKESIINGDFLNNIKIIFNRFQIDPKQINSFDLWGQEPTLTLDAINLMLPDLFNFFPNINRSLFSTNMVQYPERILEFIQTVDNLCKNRLKKEKFNLAVQFSYDGYENTKKNRGIEPEIILNNIEFFIKSLNDLKLEKTNIKIHFNNVLAKEEIIKLNNLEKVKNYWENLDKVSKKYIDLNTNPNVTISRKFGAGLEFPVNASKEEGEKFSNFIKLCKELDSKYNDEKYKGYYQIINRLSDGYRILHNSFKSFDDFITHFTNYDFDTNFIKHMSRPLFCGPGLGGLKIRYDGSLIHCHNVIHHTTLNSFNNKTGWKYEGLKALSTHNFYPNAIKDSDEILEEYFYRMHILQNTSFPHIYSLVVRTMVELRDINQIDKIYFDNEILLKHALLIVRLVTCLDGNYQMLSSGAGVWAGMIRYYCNGALNQIDYKKKS